MKTLMISLKIFFVLTILTGLIYPLLITGIAQLAFYNKANGSMVSLDNHLVGSALIGQEFDSSIYFSSRPSAILYNPLPSGGSNFGLTNAKLKKQVMARKEHFITVNHLDSLTNVPAEMIFASASGLDPQISQEAALLQVERVAKARKFNEDQKKELIQLVNDMTEAPQLTFLGKKRVNVFLLNLAVDKI